MKGVHGQDSDYFGCTVTKPKPIQRSMSADFDGNFHDKLDLLAGKIQCGQCSKLLLPNSLSRHIQLVHSEPTDWPFVCPKCPKRYPTLDYLSK